MLRLQRNCTNSEKTKNIEKCNEAEFSIVDTSKGKL
jgi:hypothetical protein